MYYLGLDDTDNLESRGTGHLARRIAEELSADYPVLGVTRHQLLVDDRIAYTKRNSCAAICLSAEEIDPGELMARAEKIMFENHQPGSDPGLCAARHVPAAVAAFGRRAQRELVTQRRARRLAKDYGIPLLGLNGDESGVIGALAAVGLASLGDDGRYVQVGRVRELSGLQPLSAVLKAGVAAVKTLDGETVETGWVLADKLRPARRGGFPVVFVVRENDHWLPLKLD